MLGDVYEISRDVPLNYVARDEIDGLLIESLTREKHLVIYGSSKQGKTCLRKYNLQGDDYIVATCSNKWSLTDLHAAILKKARFKVEQSSTFAASGQKKVAATFGGKVGVPGVAELSGSLGGDDSGGEETTTQYVNLELDAGDVNDVIGALRSISFDRFIVLEDFHYLPRQTQEDFAVALKAFHEDSDYSFLVVGVWLDENRLIQLNGDLTGRVIAISVDAWSEEELLQVVTAGEALLNVAFAEAFKLDLVKGSFDSVSLVQEACHRACREEGVLSTQAQIRQVGAGLDARALIKRCVDAQSGRYK